MYCGPHGTFPRAALNGRMKKAPVLTSLRLCKDGGMNILPWYHLGSLYPYGYSLDAAAACAAYSRTL